MDTGCPWVLGPPAPGETPSVPAPSSSPASPAAPPLPRQQLPAPQNSSHLNLRGLGCVSVSLSLSVSVTCHNSLRTPALLPVGTWCVQPMAWNWCLGTSAWLPRDFLSRVSGHSRAHAGHPQAPSAFRRWDEAV